MRIVNKAFPKVDALALVTGKPVYTDDLARYVGDPVAIVAGTTEKEVERAIKEIKVSYEVL